MSVAVYIAIESREPMYCACIVFYRIANIFWCHVLYERAFGNGCKRSGDTSRPFISRIEQRCLALPKLVAIFVCALYITLSAHLFGSFAASCHTETPNSSIRWTSTGYPPPPASPPSCYHFWIQYSAGGRRVYNCERCQCGRLHCATQLNGGGGGSGL